MALRILLWVEQGMQLCGHSKSQEEQAYLWRVTMVGTWGGAGPLEAAPKGMGGEDLAPFR